MVIGFAVLSSSITINGTSTINSNTWNVKFQNITLDTINNVTGTQSIVGDTSINNYVSLDSPGDYYAFTVDVVNSGTMDAMIGSVFNTSLMTEQSTIFDYTITYVDGTLIKQKDKLDKNGGKETFLISLYFKEDINPEDLNINISNLFLNFNINYVQADSTAVNVIHTDLYNYILKAKAGNATSTDVGGTYSVSLRNYGTHDIRVANTGNPTSCTSGSVSQSACGVVMEFTDSVCLHNMNDTDTNVGGYAASSLREFLNDDIYKSLPYYIRNSIINTSIISGHGSTSGESNFTSIDKLYILDGREIYGNYFDSGNDSLNYDSAASSEKQLDYYSTVTFNTEYNILKYLKTLSCSSAIKNIIM